MMNRNLNPSQSYSAALYFIAKLWNEYKHLLQTDSYDSLGSYAAYSNSDPAAPEDAIVSEIQAFKVRVDLARCLLGFFSKKRHRLDMALEASLREQPHFLFISRFYAIRPQNENVYSCCLFKNLWHSSFFSSTFYALKGMESYGILK
jgi:hypothetical protein